MDESRSSSCSISTIGDRERGLIPFKERKRVNVELRVLDVSGKFPTRFLNVLSLQT